MDCRMAGRIISTPAEAGSEPKQKMHRTPPSAAATCAALGALRYVPLNECLVHGHALRCLMHIPRLCTSSASSNLVRGDARCPPGGGPRAKCKDKKKTTASGKATRFKTA